MIKGIFAGIGALVLFLAFIFGMNLFGLGMKGFFAPKSVAIDNQVFHESAQYTEGMTRDLENWQLEYINGDAAKKDSIRAIVLHRFSVFPEDKMTASQRNFYNQLRSGKV